MYILEGDDDHLYIVYHLFCLDEDLFVYILAGDDNHLYTVYHHFS